MVASTAMGAQKTYRLERETLGIHTKEARRIPLMLPAGAIITTIARPLNGVRMIDVQWEDKTVMLFSADLRHRGTLLSRDHQETAA